MATSILPTKRNKTYEGYYDANTDHRTLQNRKDALLAAIARFGGGRIIKIRYANGYIFQYFVSPYTDYSSTILEIAHYGFFDPQMGLYLYSNGTIVAFKGIYTHSVSTISAGENLNTYTATGDYTVGDPGNVSNLPTSTIGYGVLMVRNAGSYILQMYSPAASGSTALYKRSSINSGSTWGSWGRVAPS